MLKSEINKGTFFAGFEDLKPWNERSVLGVA